MTSGRVALWLYVAASGLMALLRNVTIHRNSYLKEKVLRSCRDPNGKVISVLEISRTDSSWVPSVSHLQHQKLFWFLVWGTAFAVSGWGEARGGWLG